MKKLFVSFSAGQSSGYMCHLIKQNWLKEYEVVFVFANTGQEREESLVFANKCDEYFDLNLVWIEAVINKEKGKGTGFKIVDFESACRDGRVFENMIEVYGIPNTSYPHCTRELKEVPMHKYVRDLWGSGDYLTALGIRVDEPNRIGNKPKIIYPLSDPFMIDKIDVNNFWEAQPFKLELLSHQGNCSWCWKKSDKKLMMLIDETPEIFDFPNRMEEKHGLSGSNIDGTKRKFFRRHRSTNTLFTESNIIALSGRQASIFDSDESYGCSESCEPFLGEI
jgi:3'-phosphoadenosine 5'-phosphosulfate sulfotransferase (PAPS reductase)/FAD synthetase